MLVVKERLRTTGVSKRVTVGAEYEDQRCRRKAVPVPRKGQGRVPRGMDIGVGDKADGSEAARGRAEHALKVRDFFRSFKGQTCSVFGIKNCVREYLQIAQMVSRRLYGKSVFCVGAMEAAPSGPHGHVFAFRYDPPPGLRYRPEAPTVRLVRPLTKLEETALCATTSAYCLAWDAEVNKEGVLLSRWFVRLQNLKDTRMAHIVESHGGLAQVKESVLYRVTKVKTTWGDETKEVKSGQSHFAASYCLKSMWAKSHQHTFLGSVGLQPVIRIIRDLETKVVDEKVVWSAYHSSYNFEVISWLAYEVAQELADPSVDPRKLSVFTKYNRVSVIKGGNLLLKDNRYLIAGLELLRRDLHHFTTSSPLKRAVNKVCAVFCSSIREADTELLSAWALREKKRIDNKGRVNRRTH